MASKQSAKASASKEKNAANIIVVNELPRVVGFNLSTRALDHKTAVELSKDEMTRNEVSDSSLTVILKPGSNFFSGKKLEEFNYIKLHPDFLKAVNEGHLRVIDAGKAKISGKVDAPESLAGMDGPMAITVIQGTMSAEVLKTWQDEEDRETVKEAIRKQLKLVVEFDDAHAAAQNKAA